MQKEFCPYEQALELKELGFDEPCIAYLKPDVLTYEITIGEFNEFEYHSAPTFSQAFRWFREKHGLFVSPNIISYEDSPCLWFFEINSIILPLDTELGETDDYKTYEEAEFECLNKLIEIVKTKKL